MGSITFGLSRRGKLSEAGTRASDSERNSPREAINAYVQGACASRDGGLWVASDGHVRKWKENQLAQDLGPAPWGTAGLTQFKETRDGGSLVGGTVDSGFARDRAWTIVASVQPDKWVTARELDSLSLRRSRRQFMGRCRERRPGGVTPNQGCGVFNPPGSLARPRGAFAKCHRREQSLGPEPKGRGSITVIRASGISWVRTQACRIYLPGQYPKTVEGVSGSGPGAEVCSLDRTANSVWRLDSKQCARLRKPSSMEQMA